jgi:2-octaprenyl-6-methoxyphenol hydroxylase
MPAQALEIAIIGAGPVGLALAVHAARALPDARITLFDARAAGADVARDARTLALSLASVQQLERLGAWNASAAQPILEVHVSQQGPTLADAFLPWLGARLGVDAAEPVLRIRAADEGVPMLGAVLSYGAIVEPLQRAWLAAQAREPARLFSRFGTAVTALKNQGEGVEVDAGIVDSFDLAVVAEGGVFAEQARKALVHDYRQTAWVGQVEFEPMAAGSAAAPSSVAFERFTRHGPAALLPLKDGRAALVWCVNSDDDPVRDLNDAQRIAVLSQVFPPAAGRIASVSPLKPFALGLNAERTLTDGRIVRIGNAAQTLHPVAGQGLNLGLRDAFDLVRALARSIERNADRGAGKADVPGTLRRLEWQRAPDRWSMIVATDFLARSFTWSLPGAASARVLGLAALERAAPLKSVLARRMMHGGGW